MVGVTGSYQQPRGLSFPSISSLSLVIASVGPLFVFVAGTTVLFYILNDIKYDKTLLALKIPYRHK